MSQVSMEYYPTYDMFWAAVVRWQNMESAEMSPEETLFKGINGQKDNGRITAQGGKSRPFKHVMFQNKRRLTNPRWF